MSRQEAAVWLGRSMSTGEVCLQTILKLVTVISFQQHAIDEMQQALRAANIDAGHFESLVELEAGASKQILKKLAEIETQLEPVVQAVDQACKQLEKDI